MIYKIEMIARLQTKYFDVKTYVEEFFVWKVTLYNCEIKYICTKSAADFLIKTGVKEIFGCTEEEAVNVFLKNLDLNKKKGDL